MSKILDATCVGGVVSVGGVPVPNVTVLSQGTQSSSGVLLLEGPLKVYFPSNASDIQTTITKLNTALSDVCLALTSASAGLVALGQDGSVINAKVLLIQATILELTALKAALK